MARENTAEIASMLPGYSPFALGLDGFKSGEFAAGRFSQGRFKRSDYYTLFSSVGKNDCVLAMDFEGTRSRLDDKIQYGENVVDATPIMFPAVMAGYGVGAAINNFDILADNPRGQFLRYAIPALTAIVTGAAFLRADTKKKNQLVSGAISALKRCDFQDKSVRWLDEEVAPDENNVAARTAIVHSKLAGLNNDFFESRGLEVPKTRVLPFGASHYSPEELALTNKYITDPVAAMNHVLDRDTRLLVAVAPFFGWSDYEIVDRLVKTKLQIAGVMVYQVNRVDENTLELNAVADGKTGNYPYFDRRFLPESVRDAESNKLIKYSLILDSARRHRRIAAELDSESNPTSL